MSLKSNVTVHAVLWVIWFWLAFILLFSTGWQGSWYNRKYMYNLVLSVPFLGLPYWNGNTFNIEDEFKKSKDYGDAITLEKWPSGKKMTTYKIKLGCFGTDHAPVTVALKDPIVTDANIAMMTTKQYKYSEGSNSVCTCIDQLYYTSFQKYKKYETNDVKDAPKEAHDELLPPTVRTALSSVAQSSDYSADVMRWMLQEQADTQDKQYDGTGFTKIMVNAKSDSYYMQCDSYDAKDNKITDKAKCILRRDLEILSVCSRLAQNTYQIEFRGTVNSSFVTTYGVLCLFWYMFVTICRHLHDNTVHYLLRYTVYTSMLMNTALIFMYFIGVNWGLVVGESWWTDPWYGDLHRGVVVFTSFLGLVDVFVVIVVLLASTRGNKLAAAGGPPNTKDFKLRNLLAEKPERLRDLILTQMLNDVPLIVGFSILFNGLLLETGVSETHSLGIVVVMGMDAGFTQHLSNILHETSLRHLNTENNMASVHVTSDHYQIVNEIASQRVYMLVTTVFICVYLVISPRESMVWSAHVLYVLSVFVFFFVFTAFDVIREASIRLADAKSMWISVSDKEKTRSSILLIYVFGLMISSGASTSSDNLRLETK